MHDKQVRRRRAVLGLLVGVSLILLTAYFGESPSSPLHSVQRGIVAVLSPVQDGASKVLSPVRDVGNWVSDTLRAKSQRDQLKAQVQKLTTELTLAQQQALSYGQFKRELALDQSIGATSYHPVSANVIGRDLSLWYQTVEVDQGSGAGVHLNDPVIGDGALVGKVTTVNGSSAVVTLITDHSFAVPAEVQNNKADTGLLGPQVGNPNQLLLQDLPNHASIAVGDQVVTAGFKDNTNPSLQDLYPAGIPIGTVSSADQNQLLNSAQVHVAPSADTRHFTSVQVLTQPNAGNARAQVP
ncbi:MAG: rod shape-determining protein MreC [Solirubrobacteraceae bacterium]